MTGRGRALRLAALASAMLLVGTACHDAAQSSASRPRTVALQYSGAPRTTAPDFLGINGEAINTDMAGRVWDDPAFARMVATLRPGNIRLFGGTSANLWNWRTGRLARSGPPGTSGYLAGHPRTPIPIAAFTGVAKAAGATAVLVLNMVSATLASQLAAIRAVKDAGLSVSRVELGNELWSPGYRAFFQDGAAYAKVANIWIAAIHQSFPGVEVAVDANAPAAATDGRSKSWNRELFANIQGADAAVLHAYLGAPGSTVEEALSAPSRQWSSLIESPSTTVPPQLPIWVTEWNYTPTVAGNTAWARALGNALFALRLLTDRRIVLADFHALLGGPASTFAAVTASPNGKNLDGPFNYRLSAAGVVLQLLLGAVDGCRTVQAVRSVGRVRLTGLACVAPGRTRLFMLNPNSRPVTVNASAIVGPGRRWVRSAAGSPATSVAQPASRTRTRVDTAEVVVPSWGVVLMEQ